MHIELTKYSLDDIIMEPNHVNVLGPQPLHLSPIQFVRAQLRVDVSQPNAHILSHAVDVVADAHEQRAGRGQNDAVRNAGHGVEAPVEVESHVAGAADQCTAQLMQIAMEGE